MIRELRIDQVTANQNQPRQYFDENHLEELAQSIKVHGVIQPILVKKSGDHYEIVAGERRWRASLRAGMKTIPALIEEFTDQEQLEIALIENIQREDLNAMEEARAYQVLIDHYHLSQDEVAGHVGKARVTVTNALRLLKLPLAIQRDIEAGWISAGHARALLVLDTKEKQEILHRAIVDDRLSVRAAEQMAKDLNHPPAPPKKTLEPSDKTHAPAPTPVDPQLQALEDCLIETLGTTVKIKPAGPNKGRIEIAYLSLDDLDRLLAHLGVDPDRV